MRPIVSVGEQRETLPNRKVEREAPEQKKVEDEAVRFTRSQTAVAVPNRIETEPRKETREVEASEASDNDLEKRKELDQMA